MTATLKVGVAGGIWTTVAGLIFLFWLLSSPGFTTSPSFWMITSILLSIILAGILSTTAITRWSGRPRLASSLVWTAIAVIMAGCLMGAGVWDIFTLPGALLLVPAAFKLAGGEAAPSPASFGVAGGIWATICGLLIFSIVVLPALLHGQGWPDLSFPAASIVIGAMLSLAGVIIRNKMPFVSTSLMWTGILGVSAPLFSGLGYFSIYVFPALLMLVFSAIRLRRKLENQVTNQEH